MKLFLIYFYLWKLSKFRCHRDLFRKVMQGAITVGRLIQLVTFSEGHVLPHDSDSLLSRKRPEFLVADEPFAGPVGLSTPPSL